MPEVSTFRITLLRGMYLLIAAGLGMSVWPALIAPTPHPSDSHSVILAMLGGISLMSLLGLRYPLRMLPVLLFELTWKLIWVLGTALPLWRAGSLDDYGRHTLFACMVGVVLVPLALPWAHIWHRYVRAPAEAWRQPLPDA